jgi:hypothetical protein
MKHSRKTSILLIWTAGSAFLAGCGRAPSFNILGSFFPAWLICMVIGIALAAIVHLLLVRLKREKLIVWGIITYPCLAALFAFALWLVFFS